MAPNPQIFIYEINTWVWLSGLSARLNRPVDLSSVPGAEWDAIAAYGFDVVWLMGVWERSPAGIAIASQNAGLLNEFHRCLPDFRPEDNVGSAYCIRRYVVDAHLGGPAGLAIARQELAARGLRLLLDFVPNHVAPDSPWILENPQHFLQGTAADLQNQPSAFLPIGDKIFACGRDPYFPPWPDVVQVNAFDPGHRASVVQHLTAIAAQCDGVRCDMAMLLINQIFARTWGSRAGQAPAEEYWPSVIGEVHQQSPDFLFVAEAYWQMEWTLQQQGFAYCYDKRLYDLIELEDPTAIRLHLSASLDYQNKLIRFIENHDEPRAASLFSPSKSKAAAILATTLPGAKLIHEGQMQGRRIRVPVFLGRRPPEPSNTDTEIFYASLLAIAGAAAFREGDWALCSCTGWPDNATCQALGAWCWTRGEDRRLVIVNFSDHAAQARIHVPWHDLHGRLWRLADALSGATYDRDGSELQEEGLYVELGPWAGHIFTVQVT